MSNTATTKIMFAWKAPAALAVTIPAKDLESIQARFSNRLDIVRATDGSLIITPENRDDEGELEIFMIHHGEFTRETAKLMH